MIDRKQFVQYLHRALLDLYDTPSLSKSPLILLFGDSIDKKNPDQFRKTLIESIESLKPPPDTPPQSSAWRNYRILLHRYIQQIPQREIAASLGFSVRQLQRHEQTALTILADMIWNQIKKPDTTEESTIPPDHAGNAEPVQPEEINIQFQYPPEIIHLQEILRSSLRTASALLERAQVEVNWSTMEKFPRIEAKTVPLRQAIVLFFSLLASHLSELTIKISALIEGNFIRLRLAVVRPLPDELASINTENISLIKQLVKLSGGNVEFKYIMPDTLSIDIILPVGTQIPILVIDDNPDTLQLMKRALTGTRYQFIGITSPEKALATAQEVSPHCIILDVMLPSIDGWEVLSQLREHPATRHIPIVVSSILPLPDLAFSIGAVAFLKKPVSQQTLIETLDSLCPLPQK